MRRGQRRERQGDNMANMGMAEAGTGWGPRVLSGAVGLPESTGIIL